MKKSASPAINFIYAIIDAVNTAFEITNNLKFGFDDLKIPLINTCRITYSSFPPFTNIVIPNDYKICHYINH
jgi:hypothetical protein